MVFPSCNFKVKIELENQNSDLPKNTLPKPTKYTEKKPIISKNGNTKPRKKIIKISKLTQHITHLIAEKIQHFHKVEFQKTLQLLIFLSSPSEKNRGKLKVG